MPEDRPGRLFRIMRASVLCIPECVAGGRPEWRSAYRGCARSGDGPFGGTKNSNLEPLRECARQRVGPGPLIHVFIPAVADIVGRNEEMDVRAPDTCTSASMTAPATRKNMPARTTTLH